MIIENTVTLFDGSEATNLFMTVVLHTGSLETTGKAPVELLCWRSEALKDAGSARVIPTYEGNPVSSVELQFNGSEVVKEGANCLITDTFVFYKQAVADKLNDLYGWTVTL
jgi:hypothetical protein